MSDVWESQMSLYFFFFFIYFYNLDQIIGEYMNVSSREGYAEWGREFRFQPLTWCNAERSTKKNIFFISK